MNARLTQFFNQAFFLLKNYNSKQNENDIHPFRITDIKETAGSATIIFQLVGKHVFLEATIEEILENDELTKRFPSTDIRKISKLSYEKKCSPQPALAIQSQSIHHELNKIIINFQDTHGNTQQKLASDIVLDPSLIEKLSSTDAMRIGYIAGYEHGGAWLLDKRKQS